MKKFKKFLYPVLFVAGFFGWFFLVMFVVDIIDKIRPFEGYGAMAVVLLAMLAYVLLGLPFYCVRYSKIIIDERQNLLFAAYNFMVLETACLLFVNGLEEARLPLSLWILFWSAVPFVLRLVSKKRKADPEKSQLPSKTAFLLQNKTKHIVAACLVTLYVITLSTNAQIIGFYDLYSFMYYTMPAISAVFVLVFLLTKNKDYILKDYMLSIALAGETAGYLFSVCSSLKDFELMLSVSAINPVYFALTVLKTLMIILMFVGTLFGFKYIKLLKIGALGCTVLCGTRFVLELVKTLSPNEWIHPYYIASFLTQTMYFAAIYILATNKRAEQPA